MRSGKSRPLGTTWGLGSGDNRVSTGAEVRTGTGAGGNTARGEAKVYHSHRYLRGFQMGPVGGARVGLPWRGQTWWVLTRYGAQWVDGDRERSLQVFVVLPR